ncbi:hypothetical protein HCN51_54945 [Nonomuraea sp. FMUSA5-5]|uniref:Uncharacterized protein n=1 Tax=Nonomuraea composti TaxID=2720023 RepID=A0ABX1BPA9_9ACTN|nr:hypothetical protein [Nonomuraea sp. FMUSA5-5]NJP98429.1 hypothetical protein [Nonomuraea sp. FMUSA5-5]
MTGALIYSRTTPPEPGGVVGSSLILAGAVITFVGSIGRWLSAPDKDDR